MSALPCDRLAAGTCAVELRPRPSGVEVPLAEALRRFRVEARHGRCHTGRYRCRYYSWGGGPPLVFIPGMASDALSFVPLLAHLADQFRCIAYDFPAGQGDGAHPGRYRHADLAADLFALLDHLGLEKAYLFGFSFGSTVAQTALRAQPERFPRAVLQGGFACRRLAPAEVLAARLLRHCWVPLRRLPLFRALLRRSHYPAFVDRPADVWQFFVERSGAPALAAVACRALLLHQYDGGPYLADIRQPVLVVRGDLDPLVSAACTAALSGGLANAAQVELTGSGHFPMFSHPAVLADLVRQFLTPPCAEATVPGSAAAPSAPDPRRGRPPDAPPGACPPQSPGCASP